jgi:transposase-like protein
MEGMRAWAYSIELRTRAVAAYESGQMTHSQVAHLFGVGDRTLRRWRRQLSEAET